MIIEPETTEEWLDFGYIKRISVEQLMNILKDLPLDSWIYTKTFANTGNLAVVNKNGDRQGMINIGKETYEAINHE